jgi:pimeloyl-ACP methyl ester carboxylesterase
MPLIRPRTAVPAVAALALVASGLGLQAARSRAGAAPASTLASELDPVPVRALARPDGTVAYDDRGEGPLVVLAPGLGDLRQSYRFLAPRLADAGYRVVTVDLRGHGASSAGWPSYRSEDVAGDLLALVAELDAGPAVLVGNSFSAGAAVLAAAERPDAVAGLALVGPFVRDHETPAWKRWVLDAMLHGPWKVRAWTSFHATLFPSAKPDDYDLYRRVLRTSLAELGRFAAVQAMADRSDAEVEARLPDVAAPTLVLMGGADPDFADPGAEARWIAERTGGEAVVLDGLGHYPQAEDPEATAEALLAFLDGAAPGGDDATASAGARDDAR